MSTETPSEKDAYKCPKCGHLTRTENAKCEQCGFSSGHISLDSFFDIPSRANISEVASSTLSISGLSGLIDLKRLDAKG